MYENVSCAKLNWVQSKHQNLISVLYHKLNRLKNDILRVVYRLICQWLLNIYFHKYVFVLSKIEYQQHIISNKNIELNFYLCQILLANKTSRFKLKHLSPDLVRELKNIFLLLLI